MSDARQDYVARNYGHLAPTAKYRIYITKGYPLDAYTLLPLRNHDGDIKLGIMERTKQEPKSFGDMVDFTNFLAAFGWIVPDIDQYKTQQTTIMLYIEIPQSLFQKFFDYAIVGSNSRHEMLEQIVNDDWTNVAQISFNNGGDSALLDTGRGLPYDFINRLPSAFDVLSRDFLHSDKSPLHFRCKTQDCYACELEKQKRIDDAVERLEKDTGVDEIFFECPNGGRCEFSLDSIYKGLDYDYEATKITVSYASGLGLSFEYFKAVGFSWKEILKAARGV